MPMEWVEEEVLIELPTGELVYHCYKQGHAMQYHFQIPSDRSASGWMAFDIRDFALIIGWESSRIQPREILVLALEHCPTIENCLLNLDIWYEGEG